MNSRRSLSFSAIKQKLIELLPLRFAVQGSTHVEAATPNINSAIEFRGRYNYGLEFIKIYNWNKENKLVIGSFNSIALVEILLGGNHRTDWITTFPFGHIFIEEFPLGSMHGLDGHPVSKGDIVIMNDVWIGYGCTVLSGVTIGNGSVLAARSVVTKDVPPYSIVGGNPARVLKYRFNPEMIDLLLKIAWWDEDDSIINAIIPMLQSMASLDDVIELRDKILALKGSM